MGLKIAFHDQSLAHYDVFFSYQDM